MSNILDDFHLAAFFQLDEFNDFVGEDVSAWLSKLYSARVQGQQPPQLPTAIISTLNQKLDTPLPLAIRAFEIADVEVCLERFNPDLLPEHWNGYPPQTITAEGLAASVPFSGTTWRDYFRAADLISDRLKPFLMTPIGTYWERAASTNFASDLKANPEEAAVALILWNNDWA